MTASDCDRIRQLRDLVARLRDPVDGCLWDIQQTFASIAPYTIEEAYEVLEAIEQGDMDALRDELGDLLLQVLFHAQIAEEQGSFDLNDVMEALTDKLIRRHPHVFGAKSQRLTDEHQIRQAWEAQKARERLQRAGTEIPPSALKGVARSLPGLTRSLKLQRRAAQVGFDWVDVDQVWNKVQEELAELRKEIDRPERDDRRLRHELGDVLFAVVNLGRKLGLDAEIAMREANDRFQRRFEMMEVLLREQGKEPQALSLSQWLELWRAAKQQLGEL